MSFDALYRLVDSADDAVAAHFAGAPLIAALLLAAVLGLRHASDPDHLVAVTSIVNEGEGGVRGGMRIGAYWGIGHGAVLIGAGIPLILLRAQLPESVSSGAEFLVGLVIVLLAGRVLILWARGRFRMPATAHVHELGAYGADAGPVRRRAFLLGLLHGLGGSGAVVLLLLTHMPSSGSALAALLIYAPATALSMALCTGGYAYMTRRVVPRLYRTVLIPGLSIVSVAFGLWYAGLA